MRRFIQHVIRAPDGAWICVRSGAELMAPDGPIRPKSGDRFNPGETVLGLDVAKALDKFVAENGA
jgi:hypothetical protein